MKNRIIKCALLPIVLISVAFALAQTQTQTPPQTQTQPQTQPPSQTQPQAPQTQTQAPQTQTQAPQAQTQMQTSSAGLQVNPAQVQKKASLPPPAGATKTTSVGKNVKMATPGDSDSWAEQLDVDSNGTPEQTNLVWDGKDKVLYSDSNGTFTCSSGGTGTGELFIAVNGAGNSWGRPVGSGFWLASMDKGQCGAQANQLWGCRFDANGTATACGVATLDAANNDLVIVTAQR